jgi:hypothetical protein
MKTRMNWLSFTAALAGLCVLNAASGHANAQCASGNCGNVGYADGNGGFVSGSFRGASSSFGGGGPAGYSSNGGYGSWGNRQVQPLFDNYFTQGNANQADAALYISPVGVPGWVGHTYNTYQPLYPHEFLYTHKDKYHSYYDQGFGLNRTKAMYWAPPVQTAMKQAYKKIQLPRQ